MIGTPPVSVNGRAAALVGRLTHDAAELRISVAGGELGETVIDAGGRQRGSIAAGLRIAEICMGGLGQVDLVPDAASPRWPWTLVVRSSDPVVACLASQYAGWSLAHRDGNENFFALGSGPARALARKEPLFAELAYRDHASAATLVLESARQPPAAIVAEVAEDCGLQPTQLTIIYAPTQSLAGSVQVVARVLEVALHKAHELKFPLERIVDGLGAAPLAPPHPDFVTAMGRTNDAIIYAGRVHLFVTGPASDARALATALPSDGSRDHGRPFAEIFRSFKGDFYAIDKMLFSPAEVVVTAIESGESFRGGRLELRLLDASFG
ncbi:MAG TPA: methenyltetrahydromethanopterin cyclohydrolase [Xanthobacteraceae bacterium]|nr:methenyltetrahydromethanopterin cyclohydrolase [Xanthobacteraceae bacterium]